MPDTSVMVGLGVVALALLVSTALVIRSRRIINRIAQKHIKSARLLLQELKHG